MQRSTLTLIIGVLVLIVAGGALWYVLTRPLPEGMGPNATSTPSGAEREVYEDKGPFHDITVAYPTRAPISPTSSLDVTEVMKTFALQEAARFRDNNVDSLTEEDIDLLNIGGERKYTLDVDYKVYESDTTVSYVFSMFADTLGAHPNGYYRTFTFLKKTGEGLHLDDLFSPTANHLEVLSMLSREKIAENLGEGNYDQEYLEAGTTPFADNFQNFYLDGENIVIVFPPYQVGPWVIGTQTAVLSRTELGNTLSEEYR